MTILYEPNQEIEMFGRWNPICLYISIFVAFTIPFLISLKRGPMKMSVFLAVWYAAVYKLAQYPLVSSLEDEFEYPNNLIGFMIFGGLPFGCLGALIWLYQNDQQIQSFINNWPVSWTCAQQLQRIGGAIFMYLYLYEEGYDSYFNLQTGVMDIFMGSTAIPMAFYVHQNRNNLASIKNLIWYWHVFGLYDLLWAFSAIAVHYFGIYKFKHSMAYATYNPIPLIVYFQVVTALGWHILYLTKLNEILVSQSKSQTAPKKE